MTDLPIEKPPEDAAEQQAEVVDEPTGPSRSHDPAWDVNPADAAEQDVVVPLDEDEWR